MESALAVVQRRRGEGEWEQEKEAEEGAGDGRAVVVERIYTVAASFPGLPFSSSSMKHCFLYMF